MSSFTQFFSFAGVSGPVVLLLAALIGAGVLLLADDAFAEDGNQSATSKVYVGPFQQEIRAFHREAEGLPNNNARCIAIESNGNMLAGLVSGLARYNKDAWAVVEGIPAAPVRTMLACGESVLVANVDTLFRVYPDRVETVGVLPESLCGADATVVLGLVKGELILAGGLSGLYEFAAEEKAWKPVEALNGKLGSVHRDEILSIATLPGLVAVGTTCGLFFSRDEDGGAWNLVNPVEKEGKRGWTLTDVCGLAADTEKEVLWFAAKQGVGCFDGESWKLYQGADGLPYDDLTCAAMGGDHAVWFGTKIGAIRYDGKNWSYRQGLRWVADDDVRDIAVNDNGDAWFATAGGVSVIERKEMTLKEKAKYYEDEIDARHRRTQFGYVLEIYTHRPGDKAEWRQIDTDNDGLWTSMYGAGECFAYAATRDPLARQRARSAFEALRFLQTVTQGGERPAPKGFVARCVLPVSGPNPNELPCYSKTHDEMRREKNDRMWKVIHPRWPKSEDGQWYWKCDTSSDELDGHYFFYALYYDLVAESEEEKNEVRKVVGDITDHFLENDFTFIDWDGKPTRWGVFSPKELNHNPNWYAERGLNSLSMLTYLSVAEHVCGGPKYREAADKLIREHSYHINLQVAKIHNGPGGGNQSDDEMAFMNYYNLVRYEKNPELKQFYAYSLRNYWQIEAPELNPFFNFVYAAGCHGLVFDNQWGPDDLEPASPEWVDDSVSTLLRFPLDRHDWAHRNSHRTDIRLLDPIVRTFPRSALGYRNTGKVIPVDETYFHHWNCDPWTLDIGGSGVGLAHGTVFLLPYYMGLYHEFITHEQK